MHLALALMVVVGTVRGVVTVDHTPLPGCLVTLASRVRAQRVKVSGVDGRYQFAALTPGRYTLSFAFDGFESAKRTITVAEGDNEQPAQDLQMLPEATTITVACRDVRYAGYDLDTSLIAAIARRETSTLAVIRQRFDRAATYAQKHRLAAAMLRQVPDDRVYWNELFTHASNAVRFAREKEDEPTRAFIEWCTEADVDPEDYRNVAVHALELVSADPRAHALVQKALETRDSWVRAAAIKRPDNDNALKKLSEITKKP